MKKILSLIILLFVSIWSFAQSPNIPPIGAIGGTTRFQGGLKVDSGFQVPIVDTTKKWSKGMTNSGQVGMNKLDSSFYYMKKNIWYRIMTWADSNKSFGYTTKHYVDSVARILGDSSVNFYNSNGKFNGNRTGNGKGIYSLTFDSLTAFNINSTAGIILNGVNLTTLFLRFTDSNHVIGFTTPHYVDSVARLLASGVTNVATGFGLSGGPITTTGTLKVDSTKIPSWTDTLPGNRYLITSTFLTTLGYGTGTVTNISGSGNHAFSVSISNPTTTPSITHTLQNVNGHTFLGNNTNSREILDTVKLTLGDLPAGTGTVTSVSGVDAHGLKATIANPTTTPAITISLGTGIGDQQMLKAQSNPPYMEIIPATPGTDYLVNAITSLTAGTGILGGTITSTGTIQIDSNTVPKWTDTLPGNRFIVTPHFLASFGYKTGTVTSIIAGTGLSGGTITSTGTISMPNVGTAGTYGSATQVPVLTTDAEGRITGVTNTTITGTFPTFSQTNLLGDSAVGYTYWCNDPLRRPTIIPGSTIKGVPVLIGVDPSGNGGTGGSGRLVINYDTLVNTNGLITAKATGAGMEFKVAAGRFPAGKQINLTANIDTGSGGSQPTAHLQMLDRRGDLIGFDTTAFYITNHGSFTNRIINDPTLTQNSTDTLPSHSFRFDHVTTATTTNGTGFLNGNGVNISFVNAVTSVASGYGLTGGTITTTGTLVVDTTKLIPFDDTLEDPGVASKDWVRKLFPNTSISFVSYGTSTSVPPVLAYDYEVEGGSGATSILLPTGTSAAVGKEYVISDVGLQCSFNNITIDAGGGNVIVGTSSAQTFVMNINGQVNRLKKINTTTWKVQ